MADDDDDDRGGRDTRRPRKGGFKDVAADGSFLLRTIKTSAEGLGDWIGENLAGTSPIRLAYDWLLNSVGATTLAAAAPFLTAWVQNPRVLKEWIRKHAGDTPVEIVDELIDSAMATLQRELRRKGKLTTADITSAFAQATEQVQNRLATKRGYADALEETPIDIQADLGTLLDTLTPDEMARYEAYYRGRLVTPRALIQMVELAGDKDALFKHLQRKYGEPPKQADPVGAFSGALKKADQAVRKAVAPLVADDSETRQGMQKLAARLRKRTGQ